MFSGKEKDMKNDRIVSFQSSAKVYHRPNCHYAKRIKNANGYVFSRNEAVRMGFRPCKCCNSMDYLVRDANGILSAYEKIYDMQFRYIDGILYVKTELNGWKLVYSCKAEKIVIYHRNRSKRDIDFEHPDREKYHQQKDIRYVVGIKKALQYIDKHDKYWKNVNMGNQPISFTNKKYEIQAKKREKRTQMRKVNDLFRALEAQNPEYREISCSGIVV